MLSNKDIEKMQKQKILQIAYENDESPLIVQIVNLHHSLSPTYSATPLLEDRSEAAQCLLSIYSYAKRAYDGILKQLSSVTPDMSISSELPALKKESRKVQDLLTFIGVQDQSEHISPLGSGCVIAQRRNEILNVLLSKLHSFSSHDRITIDYYFEVKLPIDKEFSPKTLPFILDKNYSFPDEVIGKVILTASKTTSLGNADFQEKVCLTDIDKMDGITFENFCVELLKDNGYTNIQKTRASHDQGIDIIASYNHVIHGFQCKCYSSDVGNSAVQEANSGMIFYKCHVGIVISNSYFTKSAHELAEGIGIVLWDRSVLQELLSKSDDH